MNNGFSPDGVERRDATHPENRELGHVVACSGSRATIAATMENGNTSLAERWSVGRLISIHVGDNRVVALVDSMQTEGKNWKTSHSNSFNVEVELLGEVALLDDGSEAFSSGISRYPYLGAVAHRIRAHDLQCVYANNKSESRTIGKLSQDESIDAVIHIPSLLSKHFAVVGSTGVGKSTAVSLLLREAINSDPKLRILILDPHNEFAAAFPDLSVVIDTDKLDMPFWLMRLDELSEVIFRGRPAVPEELDVLRDLIPEAKKAFRGESPLMRRQSEKSSVTSDTPVPYRISDLLALIDDRLGRLEGRLDKPSLRSLKLRVIAAVNDPRYHFMFSSNTITDTIMETIQTIFRIPGDGKPITAFQLSGIPSEVINSVASVLTRMAFEIGLWSNGAIHILVVCEEAHRYVPADANFGFLPTRQSIARIAKEGRKYGVSLGIITQRPGELDQTILSQCSTIFAMRLTNEGDQDIIRSAIPETSLSATSFISSIGNGEAITFGEAVAVPMRMKFNRVPQQLIPKAQTSNLFDDTSEFESVDLRNIVTRMRHFNQEPDIAAFQQQVEDTLTRRQFIDESPELADEPPLDQYRPDMLPGARAAGLSDPMRTYSGFTDPQMSLRNIQRETQGQSTLGQQALGQSTLGQPAPAQTAPPPSARLDPTMSLRESILKKPLSSLYRKD
jgi:uncharacterized protein